MKNIYADIITIGDEILYGQITDTNSQWISAELDKAGIRTKRKSSVSDQEKDILEILEEAEKRSDIILITGGLGPTNDDITKKTLAKYFNSEIVLHQEALKDVTDFFARRGKELTETNRGQAFLPTSCEYIQNKCGTAPGMWFAIKDKIFISMPGVPFEMKDLMTVSMLPKLKAHFKTPDIFHQIIKTIGIGESMLADKIKDWEDQLPENIRLAYLPSLGDVKLRLTATGVNVDENRKKISIEVEKLKPYISEFIFGYADEPLEKIVGDILKEKNLSMSTAESCTGGYLAHLITSIPGSSEYYKGSIIAYHNDIKSKLLDVSDEILTQNGAVSEEAVRIMAEHVRIKLGTDIGVATSGIAGPGGGTEEKPVGTFWICYSDKDKTISKKIMLGNKRLINIQMVSNFALNMIRQNLS